MTSSEFTQIYLPLSDGLYRAAYCMLGNESDAKDVVQDLYVKLWGSLDALDSINSPRPYCLTLLRNMCIDRMRRNTRAPERLGDRDAADQDGTDSGSRERLRLVMKQIDRLPERQRLVLRMHILEDLSYEEISSRTGMSNLTLRVLMSQARKALKKI